MCEELPEELKAGITYIQVKDSEDAVGKVATTFYGDPVSYTHLDVYKRQTYNHPKYGTIDAVEVDGFGNHLLRDDANVPSLIALPYLGDVDINDPIYQNTRRLDVYKRQRLFRSKAVEEQIQRIQQLLKNQKLSWMFIGQLYVGPHLRT